MTAGSRPPTPGYARPGKIRARQKRPALHRVAVASAGPINGYRFAFEITNKEIAPPVLLLVESLRIGAEQVAEAFAYLQGTAPFRVRRCCR